MSRKLVREPITLVYVDDNQELNTVLSWRLAVMASHDTTYNMVLEFDWFDSASGGSHTLYD